MSDATSGGARRVAVVIEDDADIRHLLETVLTQAGFQTISAGNGVDGIEAVRRYEPVVTTLDVNMPGMDGFETARRIRAFSSTYIVMLTALAEEIDAMQGLDAGADDYVNKPFRPREFRARIEAMLRRPRIIVADGATVGTAPQPAPVPAPEPWPTAVATAPVYAPAPAAAPVPVPVQEHPIVLPQPPVEHWPAPTLPAPMPAAAQVPAVEVPAAQVPAMQVPAAPVAAPAGQPVLQPPPQAAPSDDGWLHHNGLWVNPQTRVVQQDGVEIDLTRSEFDLLAGLMHSTRRVRTKADLVLLLRGENYVTSHFVDDADKRAIEVHMANLRKKLSENPSSPRWIETVRGVGYRLTASDPS